MFKVGYTYADASGENWTCIWVYPDGDATMDNGVRSARASEIEWESVEWVAAAIHWDSDMGKDDLWHGHCRGSEIKNATISFPLINGEPDFTQATVTAA